MKPGVHSCTPGLETFKTCYGVTVTALAAVSISLGVPLLTAAGRGIMFV